MFREIILIPAYNELNSLKKIIKKIVFKYKKKVIVIDDNSSDGTFEFLKKSKIEFIRNKSNIGYEKTLLKGIKYTVNKYKSSKYLITFDADGEHRTKDILKLINYQNKERFDLIVCNRNYLNRFSEYLISYLFKKRFNILDPLSGFKMYSINKLSRLTNDVSSNYFLVDLTFKFLKKKFKVGNFNIIANKTTRKPKVGNSFYTNFKILKIINVIYS